jgi:signal transduction histidine kinase
LFERFHRGRNVDDRRFPGLGLGLHMCRRIVAEHGGQLWAESELGQGSAFHVALPGEQAADKAQGAA